MIKYSREICQQNMDNEQNVSDQSGKNWFQQCSLKAVLLLAEEGVNSIGDCQLTEATPPPLKPDMGHIIWRQRTSHALTPELDVVPVLLPDEHLLLRLHPLSLHPC